MKWSLLAGRFWGTEIRLHASLLLLIPYVLFAFRPADLPGALRVLLLIAAIFACVLLHEIGHTLAARLLGIEVKSIVLWPLGGFANLSRRPLIISHNLIITAAGPLTNLLLAVILTLVAVGERLFARSLVLPRLSLLFTEVGIFPFLIGLIVANFGLFFFNLIPIYPLDGGQIARDLLKLLFGEKRADQVLLLISLPLALGLVVLGLVTLDVIVLLTGLLLVLASVSLNMGLANRINLSMLYLLDRAGYAARAGDFDRAVQEYTRAINRRPNRAGLHVNRALAHYSLMEFESAWQDLEIALRLDDNNALAWTLRGELNELYKADFAEALACYNHAIKIKPDWPLSYADRGGLHAKQGRLELARADLDRAVETNQGVVVVHLLRSILRWQMGDYTGSRSDSEQALHYAPQWMLAFLEVFLVNLRGHLGWAMDYYGRAIERHPNAYQAYQGRADALRVNDRPDHALEDYHRAIRLAPGEAELYLRRGRVYHSLGRQEQSAADFQQAARLAKKRHQRRQAEAHLQQGAPDQQLPSTVSQ